VGQRAQSAPLAVTQAMAAMAHQQERKQGAVSDKPNCAANKAAPFPLRKTRKKSCVCSWPVRVPFLGGIHEKIGFSKLQPK
jgi:hypothetical protein